MHGLGNDYVYLDCLNGPEPKDPVSLARRLSNRNFGVGSDGLVLILPSADADLRMRIWNADGSEAQMCGNATRCVGKYAYEHNLVRKKTITLATAAGIKVLSLDVDQKGKVRRVKVDMGKPQRAASQIPMNIESPTERVVNHELLAGGQKWRFSAVSMGNPHCVIFVPEVETLPLSEIGPAIERHAIFPERTNVEFVKVLGPRRLRMRVWERGSGETMACGTGASAVTVAAVLTGLVPKGETTAVVLNGGELEIEWAEDEHVYMTGPATEVFTGQLSQDFLTEGD